MREDFFLDRKLLSHLGAFSERSISPKCNSFSSELNVVEVVVVVVEGVVVVVVVVAVEVVVIVFVEVVVIVVLVLVVKFLFFDDFLFDSKR